MNHRPTTARAQAHGLLAGILGERLTLDEALVVTPAAPAEMDRRFALLLTHTVLQHLGQLDAALAHYLEKPLPPKRLAVSNALRLGAAQLLLLDTPAHAAVKETVDLVKTGRDKALAGLVNAVLQKLSRERPALPSPACNLPTWLAARWQTAYGAEAVTQFAEVASHRAPLDLQVRDDYPLGTALDAYTRRLSPEHPPVETLPGYAEGTFFVQDVAASYPARLLGDVRGLRALDACAAPGGKTAQLCWAGAEVTALDRAAARMQRLGENMQRLKLAPHLVVTDALTWQPSELFDAILLDAPCTATGTWRRHPEVVHITRMEDIAEMAALQRQLLARAWSWLKPGGRLVYCVCSLEPEEGEQQAAWFSDAQTDATPLAISAEAGIPDRAIVKNMLRTTPAMLADQGGMDGFFAAGWVKR